MCHACLWRREGKQDPGGHDLGDDAGDEPKEDEAAAAVVPAALAALPDDTPAGGAVPAAATGAPRAPPERRGQQTQAAPAQAGGVGIFGESSRTLQDLIQTLLQNRIDDGGDGA